jgi:hypothetical protein
MKLHRSIVVCGLAAVALSMGACKSEDKAAASSTTSMAVKADNAMCPIGGGPIAANVTPVAYKGKHVGFCCAGCAGKFAAKSEAEKDALVASMK